MNNQENRQDQWLEHQATIAAGPQARETWNRSSSVALWPGDSLRMHRKSRFDPKGQVADVDLDSLLESNKYTPSPSIRMHIDENALQIHHNEPPTETGTTRKQSSSMSMHHPPRNLSSSSYSSEGFKTARSSSSSSGPPKTSSLNVKKIAKYSRGTLNIRDLKSSSSDHGEVPVLLAPPSPSSTVHTIIKTPRPKKPLWRRRLHRARRELDKRSYRVKKWFNAHIRQPGRACGVEEACPRSVSVPAKPRHRLSMQTLNRK